jgi:PhoPQ-activated pathogenicity-related protein
VPVYGCGYLHQNSAWLTQLGKMSPESRERWIQLWEPSRYLPAVSMPILFVNGTNDFAYPLDSYMQSIAAVPGTKQIRITVNMPHGHPPGWAPAEIGLFVDQHLRGGTPLPQLGDMQFRFSLSCKSATKLREAALHWTTGTEAINKRMWQSRPAVIEGESVRSEPPPTDATAWFVTVTDERGAIVSSGVVFAEKGKAQSP